MCGILYSHSFEGNPVNKIILEMFDAQKHRGVRGFGLFDGSRNNIVRSANEGKVLKWLNRYDSNLIMFHHRAPTSTINVKRAAHPFASKDFFGDNQYVLIHNGHISNSKELKKEHEKLGITYQSQLVDGTFNDSESLMWDFALTMEGKQDKLKAYGGIAFICVKLHKGKLDKLYFARNNNPIKMQRDKTGIVLASEGDGELVKAHELYTLSYKDYKLRHKYFLVPSYDATRYSDSWNNFRNQQSTYQTPSGHKYSTPSRKWNYKLGQWEYDNPEDDPRFLTYDSTGNPIFSEEDDFAQYESYDDYCNRNRSNNPLISNKSRDEIIQEVADLYEENDDYEAFTRKYDRAAASVSKKRILKKYKKYLNKHEGNINKTYCAVEDDYNELWDFFDGESLDDDLIRELTLLERLMTFITNDEDYRSEKSISRYYTGKR